MKNKRFISGTDNTITVENNWYKEQEEDNSHVLKGIIFISLIILAKAIMLF